MTQVAMGKDAGETQTKKKQCYKFDRNVRVSVCLLVCGIVAPKRMNRFKFFWFL